MSAQSGYRYAHRVRLSFALVGPAALLLLIPTVSQASAQPRAEVAPTSFSAVIASAQVGVNQGVPLKETKWGAQWAITIKVPEDLAGEFVKLTYQRGSEPESQELSIYIQPDGTGNVNLGYQFKTLREAQVHAKKLRVPTTVKVRQSTDGEPVVLAITKWQTEPVYLVTDVKMTVEAGVVTFTGRTTTQDGKAAGGVRVVPAQFISALRWGSDPSEAVRSSKSGRFLVTSDSLKRGRVGVAAAPCNPFCFNTFSSPFVLK